MEFIKGFIERNGYPPTIREISERFGYSSPSGALVHVEALQRKGYIHRQRLPRSISIAKGTTGVEVVLAEVVGRIQKKGEVFFSKEKKRIPLPTERKDLIGLVSKINIEKFDVRKGDYLFFERVVRNGLSLIEKSGIQKVVNFSKGLAEDLDGKRVEKPFKVIASFYGLLRIPEGRKKNE